MVHVAALAAAAVLGGGWTQVGTGPQGGTVWAGRIPNTYVHDTRASVVYLPPGYSAGQRYPVLYLLHGLRGSPSEYWSSLHLADLLDTMFASGAKPFIVITPVGGQVVHPNDGEWAGPWERYVVHDVVPWVDAHLSTIASASGRSLEGLCAGGFGAIDIGLRNPGLFGTLGSWEGYFTPFRDGPFAHATPATLRANTPTLLLGRAAPLLRREHVRFYISAGGNHAQIRGSWSRDFAGLLTRFGIDHELWLLPRAERGHFWTATVPSALQYAFPRE